jgi:RNA polymerase sigma-70 factor (ECF subfamily)
MTEFVVREAVANADDVGEIVATLSAHAADLPTPIASRPSFRPRPESQRTDMGEPIATLIASSADPCFSITSDEVSDATRFRVPRPRKGRLSRSASAVDPRVRRGFRDGDPAAVREVYRCYGRLVYAVAYRVLQHHGLAEEATQQAFLKAWRAARSFDENRELGPWLAAIARRVAIDVYRREGVRTVVPLDCAPAGDLALISSPEAAEAVYDVWEVRRAVAELPSHEHEIVRLQHFEGLTHEQIARRLQLAVGTVKSRSFKAHRRLAEVLGHLKE